MYNMSLKKEEQLSASKMLEGALSALLILPAGKSLEAKDLHDDKKINAVLELPEQRQAVDLVHLIEMQLLTESYAAALKTSQQLYLLLENFYKKKRTSIKRFALLKQVFLRLFEEMGDHILKRGFSEEALLFYEAVLSLNPDNTAILKKKGRLFYIRGAQGLTEAEQVYREALKKDPGDLDNYENLGRVLEAWGDQEEDAAFIYREALSHCQTDLEYIRFYHRLYNLFPGDPELCTRLGKLYRRLGMFAKARRYLEEAWEHTTNSWIGLDLAWLYLLTNELRLAAELLTRVESLPLTAPVADEGDTTVTSFQWKKDYLLGLLREEEGDFPVADDYYRKVESPSKVFWLAQGGLARLALYRGNYEEAETILRRIPASQRSELEQDYFELCRLMEETMSAGHPMHAAAWSEDSGKHDPHYQLKRDIYSRSMGPAFWRKYEIIDILDYGPAGQVYLGREQARGRKMAIKMIRSHMLGDSLVVRRLLGRIKTLKNNEQHDAILFPEGDCYYNGDLYYAMEYMEGGNLASLLKQAPLRIDVLLKYSCQLLKALDYLYRYKKAFFHGAIKPENILIDENGNLKISDFDLLETIEGAKLYTPTLIRKHSSFIRTFLYAAPERFDWSSSLAAFLLRGKRMRSDSPEMALEGADHRADLYSLGVIMYEMATGFLPYRKTDLKSIRAYQRSAVTPAVVEINPAIPSALGEIISGLLQKDPGRRFSSPAVVLNRLQSLMRE